MSARFDGESATMLEFPPSALRSRMLAQGRATIQLIGAAQVLLTDSDNWSETLLLKIALEVYQRRWRRMIAVLPPEWSMEILAGESIKNVVPDR